MEMEPPPPLPKSGDTSDVMSDPDLGIHPFLTNHYIGLVIFWVVVVSWVVAKIKQWKKVSVKNEDKQDKS